MVVAPFLSFTAPPKCRTLQMTLAATHICNNNSPWWQRTKYLTWGCYTRLDSPWPPCYSINIYAWGSEPTGRHIPCLVPLSNQLSDWSMMCISIHWADGENYKFNFNRYGCELLNPKSFKFHVSHSVSSFSLTFYHHCFKWHPSPSCFFFFNLWMQCIL